MKLVSRIVLAIICLGICVNAYADPRSYVWTYEYMTMYKGTKEFEYYLTAKIPDVSASNKNSFEHQFELEYGITNHWDIALYQKLLQKNNESDFEYGGFKLRSRYRFGEKGKYLVDPLLYLEYIRDDDFSNPHVLEVKLILAKDIGKFNLAYNQIIKQVVERGGLTEHEYASGINYRLNRSFGLGLEVKGNYTDGKYYLGPTVSYFSKKAWISCGVVTGLNSKSDELQLRTIVGVPF